MPIDPQGEVAARLATLLGEAPARIYPLGRDGFLHRGAGAAAGNGLFCTDLRAGDSRHLDAAAAVILDVRSDVDELTAVLVRAEQGAAGGADRNAAQVIVSSYRVFLIRPDCAYRELHVLTASRDAQAEMCGRGPAIGVERAQRVLDHALVVRNGRITAVRLEIDEHDCVTGEIRKRTLSRPLAGAAIPAAGEALAGGVRHDAEPHCYCD